MKKILLAILTIISIFVIASCGKKKVLTKRTMADFYDDFTFGQSETSEKNYNRFKAFSKNEKAFSNEFSSQTSSYSKLYVYPTKKVKIEGYSYTLYNKSDEQKIQACTLKNDTYYKLEKNTYYLSTDLMNLPKVDIDPSGEKEFTVTFENLEIKNKSTIVFFFGVLSNDKEFMENINKYGGLYNFKIEYSAYI